MMNSTYQALIFIFLCTIFSYSIAEDSESETGDQDKFSHSFFSSENGWNDTTVTVPSVSKKTSEINNLEDCAVPIDETSVAPKKPKHIKKRIHKNDNKRIKPVKLVPEANKVESPGEALSKVITDETKLAPIHDQKYPTTRPVYDYRNKLPEKFYQDKNGIPQDKDNVHIPKLIYQKDFSELLFPAIEKRDLGAVAALLERGAGINAVTTETGFTPLMSAVWFNNEQAVNFLIMKGADLNRQNKLGQTSLHIATINGNSNIIDILLRAGIKWEIKDSENKNAMDYARLDLRNKMLITVAEIAKNINAALLEMSCMGSTQAVKVLIERGANLEVRNKNGDTPLIIASRHNDMNMASLLLSNGAQPQVYNMNSDSPLTLAKNNQNQALVDVIQTLIIKQELDSGAVAHATKENFLNNSKQQVNKQQNLKHSVPSSVKVSAQLSSEKQEDNYLEYYDVEEEEKTNSSFFEMIKSGFSGFTSNSKSVDSNSEVQDHKLPPLTSE